MEGQESGIRSQKPGTRNRGGHLNPDCRIPTPEIGEARRIPVDGSEMVFSGTAQIFGRTGREMAQARGLDPEAMQDLASAPGDTLARTLRE
jgi:hypothetical protein